MKEAGALDKWQKRERRGFFVPGPSIAAVGDKKVLMVYMWNDKSQSS